MIATAGSVTGLRDVPRASGGPPLPPLPEDTRPSLYRDFLKPMEPGNAIADVLLVPPPEEALQYSRWSLRAGSTSSREYRYPAIRN